MHLRNISNSYVRKLEPGVFEKIPKGQGTRMKDAPLNCAYVVVAVAIMILLIPFAALKILQVAIAWLEGEEEPC